MFPAPFENLFRYKGRVSDPPAFRNTSRIRAGLKPARTNKNINELLEKPILDFAAELKYVARAVHY
jgi:hypothetical protein